jgi:divalent metal cation (Fe/Co/Zn/Cd) transporter
VKLKPALLVYWFLAGAIFGASFSAILVASGQPFPQSPSSLAITLVGIAIAVCLATLPIQRYKRQLEKKPNSKIARPNPLTAFRLFVLSRATTIAAAGFVGWHLGQLIWLVSFTLSPAGLVGPTLYGLLASVAMLAGGLVAESNCKLPKDPDGEAA